MAESDAPILRIPLMSRHGLIACIVGIAFFASIALLFFLSILSKESGFRWLGFGFAVLPSVLAAAGFALAVKRFGRKALVLDHDGVWLEEGRRRGLLWSEVTGYEIPTGPKSPVLRVLGRDGKELVIPHGWGSDFDRHHGAMLRELDRRVGPDGKRPVLAADGGELSRRLLHHYGAIPAVELESDLPYRYIQPDALAGELRSRIGMLAASLLAASMLSPSILKMGDALSAILGAFLVVLGSLLIWSIAIDLKLLQSLKDRFVRRGERLYILRKGREVPLPPAKVGPRRFLGRQPTTIHGRGLFPYRMAPQLLEPDV